MDPYRPEKPNGYQSKTGRAKEETRNCFTELFIS